MKETSKACRRRWCEDARGEFPWKTIFSGKMIDIGPGDDPLPFQDCVLFDKKDGDANKLSSYFPAMSFDTLHASQALEHMVNPYDTLMDWAKVVRPRGHLVITVPEATLYGDMMWFPGSRFNGDHKSTFSMWHKGSPAPIHCYVPEFTKRFREMGLLRTLLSRVVDTNYDYKIGFSVDQTLDPIDGAEAFVEMVFCKMPE